MKKKINITLARNYSKYLTAKNNDKIMNYYNSFINANINNKNNISNVSININNISNINISNNNYSNDKNHNNDFFTNKNNDQTFSLTFFSGKSQEKCGKQKNIKNFKNFPFKLFSTGNSENNFTKKVNKKLDVSNDRKKNIFQKTQQNHKKFNSLLSTILNYDKILNKSKYANKTNKNNIPIKKMVLYKNQKPKIKEKSK